MTNQIEIIATPAQIRTMIERAEGAPVGRQATREKAAARLRRALAAKHGAKGAEYADLMVLASDPYDVDRYFHELENPGPAYADADRPRLAAVLREVIEKDEAPKAAEAPRAEPKPRAKGGKRAEAEAAAAAGIMPTPPDFSAATHAPHRKVHAEIVALAEAGDIAALKAWEHKPYSSSQKSLARYRDLAVMALEARAG